MKNNTDVKSLILTERKWVHPVVVALLCAIVPLRSMGAVYAVGPNQQHATPSEIPWENLKAGDTVRIHWRSEPYRDKWVVCARGTKAEPIHIVGMRGGKGNERPVIDGDGAKTRDELNFWGEERGVIKIGGANQPEDRVPAHIVVEGLAVKNGRPPFAFTGRNGSTPYKENAAGIYVSKGENITIRDCEIYECGNGIFSSYNSRDVVIEKCYIHDNGIEESIYHHNTYTESAGIRYQFNRFGPLRIGCYGNNIKDRSSGTVIHANWIEGGSKLLDLVETTHDEIRSEPDYADVVVAGNVLIKIAEANRPHFVHYGGDQGNAEFYRLGTLYFFNNTVISRRPGPVDVFKFGDPEQKCEAVNNIFWGKHFSIMFVLADANGLINLGRNWVPIGFVSCHFDIRKHLKYNGVEFFTGISPSFIDNTGDYGLNASSNCVNNGVALPARGVELLGVPLHQYIPHCSAEAREVDQTPDLGAFELPTPTEQ